MIDENRILKILAENKNPAASRVKEAIAKAGALKGLCLEDAACLLQCEDQGLFNDLFSAAKDVKEAIYGNRLVLFAPLYLSSWCVNNCLYCGFRKDNKSLHRKRLTLDQIKNEVEFLLEEGHKRLLLVAGEDPETANINFLTKAIETVYKASKGPGAIRRVNVNVSPLSVRDFRALKRAGIGTYQLFQETYHRKTYEKAHPEGPKRFFENRLYAIDAAMRAGIDDVGIGVLFGLYDYKFEVMALLQHALHLEKKFGVGPHTISVPRIKHAQGAPLAGDIPYPVSDLEFKKIVAIIRLAVPYTGIILSTRESAVFRDEVFALGVSQISAGSRASVGAYSEDLGPEDLVQFSLDDKRTQLEVVKDMVKEGFFPSFCTACYRTGRTGRDFMELAKPGEIKNFCLPNCILTFEEYVLDYGDEELRESASGIISKELENISSDAVREKTKAKLEAINSGQRDLYF